MLGQMNLMLNPRETQKPQLRAGVRSPVGAEPSAVRGGLMGSLAASHWAQALLPLPILLDANDGVLSVDELTHRFNPLRLGW